MIINWVSFRLNCRYWDKRLPFRLVQIVAKKNARSQKHYRMNWIVTKWLKLILISLDWNAEILHENAMPQTYWVDFCNKLYLRIRTKITSKFLFTSFYQNTFFFLIFLKFYLEDLHCDVLKRQIRNASESSESLKSHIHKFIYDVSPLLRPLNWLRITNLTLINRQRFEKLVRSHVYMSILNG